MAESEGWWSDPDVLERIYLSAIREADVAAVEAVLMRMAFLDPARAQRMYDDLKLGLHIAAGGDVRVRLEPVGDPRG